MVASFAALIGTWVGSLAGALVGAGFGGAAVSALELDLVEFGLLPLEAEAFELDGMVNTLI